MSDHPTPATATRPHLDREATDELVAWATAQGEAAEDRFDFARRVSHRFGAQPQDDGSVSFAFWVPRLVREQVADADVHLEVLDPVDELDITVAGTQVRFRRTRVPLRRDGALVGGVLRGVTVGTRDRVGSFYCVAYRDRHGTWRRVLDPMASSLPFGAFAPAEVHDLTATQRDRADRGYWQQLAEQAGGDRCGEDVLKRGPVANILQVHVPTATAGGTLASLTRWFEELAATVASGERPRPDQQAWLGYDAVQLLPVEPTTVYESGPPFWHERSEHEQDGAAGSAPDEQDGAAQRGEAVDAVDAGVVTVDLRRPDTTNWGYDVVIAGSATVNPTLLESGRPDELVDLAAALHTFPSGPIQLVADVVYGHSDNQGVGILDDEWFAGANMYGQDMAYREPFVRALLLEMQRRKVDFGFDAVRVDGAQDFKYYDVESGEVRHDDEFLQSMSDVVQEVAGCRYRPWMVFEDGRPWPQPDWELSSTYRAVVEAQVDDDAFQWGPLTFAHNTPFVYGFWLRSWWRIRQIMHHGENWISGCANHDTLRRGTQVSPKLYINDRLGDTKLQILDKAYDNPAITLLTYCTFPGVPMDFVNASVRGAWGFIRNQDDRYGVKVFSEEAISLVWQVDDELWSAASNFKRCKGLGFETLAQFRRFTDVLPALVEVTDYDLPAIARLLEDVEPPLVGPPRYDVEALKAIARAWMDDMHDYSNVTRWTGRLASQQTSFNAAVREFRRARRWLRDAQRPGEDFTYLRPVDGHAVFVGLRVSPHDGEEVLLVCNMEGGPIDLVPERVGRDHLTHLDEATSPLARLDPEGWDVALRTPDIGTDWIGGPITLHDSAGVVLTRGR